MTMQEFASVDRAICAYVINTLDPTVLIHVQSVKARKGLQMYHALSEHFESKSTVSARHILQQMLELRQNELTMEELIAKARLLKTRLEAIIESRASFNMVDEIAIVALVESLSPEYAYLKEVLAVTHDSEKNGVDFDTYAQTLLRRSEATRLSTTSTSSRHAAHAAILRPAVKCSFCQREGHTEEKCRHKMKAIERCVTKQSDKKRFIKSEKDANEAKEAKAHTPTPSSSPINLPPPPTGARAWTARKVDDSNAEMLKTSLPGFSYKDALCGNVPKDARACIARAGAAAYRAAAAAVDPTITFTIAI